MHDLLQQCKHAYRVTWQHAYRVTSCDSCGVSAPPCSLCRASQVGSGYYSDIANSIGALQIWPEHRYYATQQPFKPSDSKFVYLNIEQALVDQIEVVLHTQRTLGLSQSPVIAIGSSYSKPLLQRAITAICPCLLFFSGVRVSIHCSVSMFAQHAACLKTDCWSCLLYIEASTQSVIALRNNAHLCPYLCTIILRMQLNFC